MFTMLLDTKFTYDTYPGFKCRTEIHITEYNFILGVVEANLV